MSPTAPGNTIPGHESADEAHDFVLVHGAFHGGWCWSRVARILRAAGHSVHTPSQTGLGDRRHLLSELIDMRTFVADITSLLEAEEIDDAVLVGHSFGGRTIAGVADVLPERLRHLVFLDAAVPTDGRSRMEAMSPEEREERLARAQQHDGGLSVPPPPATRFGVVDAEDVAWVERRMTPQPIGVEKSRLPLEHEIGNGVPATYLHCTAPAFPVVEPSARYARNRSDWRYVTIGAGHESMITAPEVVARHLVEIADGAC
jgi:pimeloyl-ACP methyl ester carboxylesterase